MSPHPDFKVWDGVYASFDEAPATGPGFEGSTAHERGMQAALEVRSCLDRGEPLDYSLRQRNALLPVVVAMLLAERAQVSVLDFGGGLGTGYMMLEKALPQVQAGVRFTLVEVEGLCSAGRSLFSEKQGPVFWPSLPDGGAFDLIHTASTMQYVDDWRGVVARLAGYGARYLVFADSFVGPFASYVTLQNYYGSRIRHWFFNFDAFKAEVEQHGYTLALRLSCDARILGAYGPLPMDNFPPALRIAHTSHLLFQKNS